MRGLKLSNIDNFGCLLDKRWRKPLKNMAERVGFEPTVPRGTTVFKTVSFGHSDTSPDRL